MTECQGCGAWNDTSRTLCVLCGTPLAEIDEWDPAAELPPLPPLPDGGLRSSMPTWLREPPPSVAESLPVAGVAAAKPTSDPAAREPLGPRADPRAFLTDDDFPQWLHDLAARREEPSLAPEPAVAPELDPAPDGRPAAAVVAARALEERRGRDVWETLLLVLLVIGVIVAALWALVANGAFSPGF